MGKRSASSRRWLRRQAQDPWTRRARDEGWRSRAVFKLEEIDRVERLLRPGQVVVDLGAAPGGWSQYAARRVGGSGTVIALDLLEIDALAGVEVLQGDFTEEAVLASLLERLGDRRVDVVLSDMAPNATGMRAVDQPRSMYLAELAMDFAVRTLAPGGDLLVKVFQGEGFEAYVAEARRRFERVRTRKPAASRSDSREVYLVARNFAV